MFVVDGDDRGFDPVTAERGQTDEDPAAVVWIGQPANQAGFWQLIELVSEGAGLTSGPHGDSDSVRA